MPQFKIARDLYLGGTWFKAPGTFMLLLGLHNFTQSLQSNFVAVRCNRPRPPTTKSLSTHHSQPSHLTDTI
jgi:hypothetical protein